MAFWDLIVKVVFGLVPPSFWKLMRGSRLANPERQHERRAIDRDIFVWEVWMSAVSISAVAFILLASGWMPGLGGGFAYAEEQKLTAKQVLATRTEQLEWRMFDLRVKQCEAIKKGESAQVYTLQLAQLMKTYVELQKRDPKLPDCNQI